jgi:hypothetical protein
MTTTKTWGSSLAMSFALLLACGCSSAPPPATPMTFANFNVKDNDQKQISLEGYARIPAACMVSDTMLVDLFDNPEGKGKPLPFSCRVGSSANHVEKPPKNYTANDLKLHANDGSLVESGKKIRVAGKFVFSTSSSILFAPIDIQKI